MSARRRRLRLTPRAREDVRQALLFSRRRWGERQRRRDKGRLTATMANLAESPEFGQPRVEPHVLFDRLTEEEVIVGRVLRVRQEAAGRVVP